MIRSRASRFSVMAVVTMLVVALLIASGGSRVLAATSVDWQQADEETLPSEVSRWVNANAKIHGIHVLPADDTRYLLVSWGEKPTGGYGVAVTDVTRSSDDELLTVSVELTSPGPDDVVTQALTYPSTLVELPAGDETVLVNFYGDDWFGDEFGEPSEDDPAILLDAETNEDSVAPNPLVVRGRAQVFEATMNIVLEDGHYQLRNHWLTLSEGGPGWAEFEVALMYPTPSQAHGTVIGSYENMADGSLVEVAYEPVEFGSISSRLADVDGHWAEASIRQGVWAGFVDGYPDDNFRPDELVTRAEFIKMLVTGTNGGTPDYTGSTPFTDVDGHWAEVYIGWAAEQGWISAEDDGPAFMPDMVISREVMARWAAKAAGLEPGEEEPVFQDTAQIQLELQPWVSAAANAELILGYPDDSFRPELGLKRSEAVTVVLRVLDTQQQ